MSVSVKGNGRAAEKVAGNGSNYEFGQHLTTLSGELSSTSPKISVDRIESQIAGGLAVRQLLADSPKAKDTFRYSNGFEVLLSTLNSLLADGQPNQKSPQHWLHLLRIVFSILASSLGDHRGNQRYFRGRITNGGWESLYQTLDVVQQSTLKYESEAIRASEQHILSCLFACAINDDTVQELFRPTESELLLKSLRWDNLVLRPQKVLGLSVKMYRPGQLQWRTWSKAWAPQRTCRTQKQFA